jgi:hypothetical protein
MAEMGHLLTEKFQVINKVCPLRYIYANQLQITRASCVRPIMTFIFSIVS